MWLQWDYFQFGIIIHQIKITMVSSLVDQLSRCGLFVWLVDFLISVLVCSITLCRWSCTVCISFFSLSWMAACHSLLNCSFSLLRTSGLMLMVILAGILPAVAAFCSDSKWPVALSSVFVSLRYFVWNFYNTCWNVFSAVMVLFLDTFEGPINWVNRPSSSNSSSLLLLSVVGFWAEGSCWFIHSNSCWLSCCCCLFCSACCFSSSELSSERWDIFNWYSSSLCCLL